jgi:hypothetical protein
MGQNLDGVLVPCQASLPPHYPVGSHPRPTLLAVSKMTAQTASIQMAMNCFSLTPFNFSLKYLVKKRFTIFSNLTLNILVSL